MDYLFESGDLFLDEETSHHPQHLTRLTFREHSNGDNFTGSTDLVTGEPLHGTLRYHNGDTYSGPFVNSKRHGDNAVYTLANGGKFIGSYRNDKPTYGTLITDVYTYRGKFLETAAEFSWMFHGEGGSLVLRNGGVYIGEFRHGLFHGGGTESHEAYEYRGEFRNGAWGGFGTLKVDTNMGVYIYRGNWAEGEMIGEGIECLVSGEESSVFVGCFDSGRRHGYGGLIRSDGTVLEGKWARGEAVIDDRWKITYSDGTVYVGYCKACASTAAQKDKEQDGQYSSSFKNLWQKGEPHLIPHGKGVLYYAKSCDVFCGDFNDGMRHGNGVYIVQKTGGQYAGDWINDKPAAEVDDEGILTKVNWFEPVEMETEWNGEEELEEIGSHEGADGESDENEDILLSLEDTIALAKPLIDIEKRRGSITSKGTSTTDAESDSTLSLSVPDDGVALSCCLFEFENASKPKPFSPSIPTQRIFELDTHMKTLEKFYYRDARKTVLSNGQIHLTDPRSNNHGVTKEMVTEAVTILNNQIETIKCGQIPRRNITRLYLNNIS